MNKITEFINAFQQWEVTFSGGFAFMAVSSILIVVLIGGWQLLRSFWGVILPFFQKMK